jgi:hypothetical protein
MNERCPQVEGQGEFNCALIVGRFDFAGGMAMILKAGEPPRLRLIRIDRLGVVVASTGMRDMVDATTE